MALENQAYVPTLAVRASEMKGLEFLPGVTKDRMTPCILLAPWANSNTLDRAITRVERAFHNRNYFLTPDPDYQTTNDQSIAQQEFSSLLVPDLNYANWIEFVRRYENVWPCIQTQGQTEAQIRTQIQTVQDMGRRYCLRIVYGHIPQNLTEIVNAFAAGGAADFTIILEGGWTDDPLSLTSWFAGMVTNSLGAIDASVPIVCSCTSIPKMFSRYNADQPQTVGFSNRQLIHQITQNTNRASVIYGDWGSTRPRENGGFASRPLDRIDFPTEQAWHIARNKNGGWDFRDAALAVVNSTNWDGNLGLWGEEMIQQTTINEELGIDTPQKNVAARVNIHLHRQAFYGQDRIDPLAFEENWED